MGFACSSEKLEPLWQGATMLGVELDLESATDGVSECGTKLPEWRKPQDVSMKFFNMVLWTRASSPPICGSSSLPRRDCGGRAEKLA